MITGYVRRQALEVSAPVLVADTIDYLTARFVFMTGDWDGLEVWAHFRQGDTAYDFRLDENGEITADQHLNLTEGVWTVYLSGHLYSGGAMLQRISTQQAEVKVVKSGMVNANPFPPLPATVEEQIFAELSDHEERLSDIEQNGTGGGGGGTGDITGAVRYDVLQELTDEQKMQARSNTGAASKTDVDKRLGELSNAKADLDTVPNGAVMQGNTMKFQRSTVSNGATTTKNLFEVQIPTGGSGTDISLGVTGATVGQIAKITAVDDNGVPTAWEAAELEGWKLAGTVTSQQTNETLEISGFTSKHILVIIYASCEDDSEKTILIKFNDTVFFIQANSLGSKGNKYLLLYEFSLISCGANKYIYSSANPNTRHNSFKGNDVKNSIYEGTVSGKIFSKVDISEFNKVSLNSSNGILSAESELTVLYK